MSMRREDLERASELVHRWVPATPQYAWPLLADALGAEAWVTRVDEVNAALVRQSRGRADRVVTD